MIRRLFENIKLNSRFTFVILAFTIIPIAVFSAVLFYNIEDDVKKESYNYMESKASRDYGHITTNIESINMSTRFFLSDEGLMNILTDAYDGTPRDSQEIVDFYNYEIADLERLVNNNPSLYAVRVYSVTDNVQEMMPVLYNNSRMQKLSWYDGEKEGWHFGYYDTLFSSLISNQRNELASFVTPINDYDRGLIGYVESAMTMEALFPEIFIGDEDEWSFFADADGNILFGDADSANNSLLMATLDEPADDQVPQVIYKKIAGRHYTIARYPITVMDGTMYSVQDITEGIRSVYYRRNLFALIMLVVIIAVAVMMNRMVKSFQMEVLSQNSELRSLQNQINAHFIYNVLESIKMMAEIDEEYEISDAITSLGKLMRYSMKWNFGNVHLSEELEYIKNYVLLINLRYDFEVILSINVPEELMNQEVLKMSLQPIVENCVVHGIEPVAADTTIYIKAWEEGKNFRIEITDSGKGMTEEELTALLGHIHGGIEERGGSEEGIGLKNVEDRIKLSFGSKYGLEIYSEPMKYTKVSILLPRRVLERKGVS